MKKLILALLAGASLMGAAQAEGAYVGAGATWVKNGYNDYKPAAKVFGGFGFDKTWGVEAGYIDFARTTSQLGTATAPFTIGSDGHASYLAGTMTLPLNEQFSLLGKLGVANVKYNWSNSSASGNISGSESRTNPYASIGVKVDLTKQVALTAEAERFGNTRSMGKDAPAYSLAARYNF